MVVQTKRQNLIRVEQQPGKRRERNSAMELLRILAMFLIVLHHYCVHGGFNHEAMGIGINLFLVQFARLGDLGVDLFMMISGFFMIRSKPAVKKGLTLWSQVWFYSVAFFLLFYLMGRAEWTKSTVLPVFFPVIYRAYWFFTAYLLVYIFSPYVNRLLGSLDFRAYTKLLVIALAIWSVIPTVFNKHRYDPSLYGNELIQLLLLYAIGGYIRLYRERFDRRWLRYSLAPVCMGMMFLSTIVMDTTGNMAYSTYFYDRPSILTIGAAVGLMLIFLHFKPFHSRFINGVAACTFGVYLIHDNNLVRPFLWGDLLHNAAYSDSSLLIVHMVISVVGVYLVCTAIEFVRRMTVEKLVILLIGRCYPPVTSFGQRLIRRIFRK